MHHADDDEQESLITRSERRLDGDRWTRQPSRGKRVRAISTLVLVLLPFVFLLWMTSWHKEPSNSVQAETPPSDAFALDQTFDLAAPPETRVYHWTVSEVPVPGANRNRTVVNGHSPGPLIEANEHDRVLVYVTNGLEKDGTSIHWHGLPQPQTPFYDGAAGISQCPIPPGATLLYNFTFGGWTGTTWWHGHIGMQHTDGLFGPLVVHSPAERAHDYAADHVLTLSDSYASPASELLVGYLAAKTMETAPEPVPDGAAINGRGGSASDEGSEAEGYFEVQVQERMATRLRLIHAGTFAPLRVSVDGHVLVLIDADGTPLAPVPVRDLLMQPAQRYSVLVARDPTDTREEFWIRARMVEDKFAYENHAMQPEARAVLRYSTSPSSSYDPPSAQRAPLPTTSPGAASKGKESEWYALPQFDEWALRPASTHIRPAPVEDVLALPVTFSIQRTHAQNWRSFINNTAWEVPASGEAALVRDTAGVFAGKGGREGVMVWPGDQLIATLAHGQIVDLVITNLDDGDHPFHLHGYSPFLLGTGRGRFKLVTAHLETANPMRRDTFTVPARGWAVVRFVADNPGYWAFHCHIAWHMMGGGLFQIAVPPADSAPLVLPEDIVRQCEMWDA